MNSHLFSIPVPPGPPKDLHHVDVDKTEVWLVWNWPDRNGGSEITGFLVEYQEEGAKDWEEWKTVSIPETHVTGLEEGKTYRFRVRAENAIGLSRPDTTVPILCQEKLGDVHEMILFCLHSNFTDMFCSINIYISDAGRHWSFLRSDTSLHVHSASIC